MYLLSPVASFCREDKDKREPILGVTCESDFGFACVSSVTMSYSAARIPIANK